MAWTRRYFSCWTRCQSCLDISTYNFGIQEYSIFGENTKEVFPGCPEVKEGMMWPNSKPGLGIDIDEKLAKKFPFKEREYGGAWIQ